jgi:hypothetical protein
MGYNEKYIGGFTERRLLNQMMLPKNKNGPITTGKRSLMSNFTQIRLTVCIYMKGFTGDRMKNGFHGSAVYTTINMRHFFV